MAGPQGRKLVSASSGEARCRRGAFAEESSALAAASNRPIATDPGFPVLRHGALDACKLRVVMDPAPRHPWERVGLDPPPRHQAFIALGYVLAALNGILSVFLLAPLTAPSDPCVPTSTECGPEAGQSAALFLLFLTLTGACLAWSTAWQRKDSHPIFTAPPNWPQPPAGWSPSPGWNPLPQWPPAPQGWRFWR